MKITKTAFSKAIASNLSTGNRITSGKVVKALQQVGLDPRFKGEVKDSQLRTAFEKLKQEGLLKSHVSGAGLYAFKENVQKAAVAEANPGISKERQLAIAKSHLRERLDEEAAKKQRISEALGGTKTGQNTTISSKKSISSSQSHVIQPVQRAAIPFGNVPRKETVTSETSRPLSAAQLIERGEKPASNEKNDVQASSTSEEKTVVSMPAFERREEPPDMFGSDE